MTEIEPEELFQNLEKQDEHKIEKEQNFDGEIKE